MDTKLDLRKLDEYDDIELYKVGKAIHNVTMRMLLETNSLCGSDKC